MDIRQWLKNTEDREPPDERFESGFPAFLQPQPDAVQARRSSRRKRKRASSGSSNPARRPSVQYISSEQPRLAGTHEVVTSSRSSSSSNSQSRQSTISRRREAPIEIFERRARRKTKPGRYEAKPKRRQKEHRSVRERRPEARRRKSHRTGDGARTTGLVQSFRIKNGPKNQRLTLKPDASAGIFKNGRASGPIATSGPGLPDLVFNEMRFLRRPKEHQDEVPGNGPKTQSKNTQKQAHEEEISAYFNRNLPPDKHTRLSRSDAARSQTCKLSAQKRPTEPAQARPQPPVELPERAFLGLGSRGPAQDSIESQHPSNSCYTWSQSLPAKPSPAPGKPVVPAFDATQAPLEHHERHMSEVPDTPPRRSETGSAEPQQTFSPGEAGQWVDTRRAKRRVRVEMYRAPKDMRRSTSAVDVFSEPPPRATEVNNAELAKINNGWERDNYHTSDILKIKNTTNGAFQSPAFTFQDRVREAFYDKEDEGSATSTPTSERLRRCFRAVSKLGTVVADTCIQARPSRQSREDHDTIYPKPARMQFSPPGEHVQVTSSPLRSEMPQRGFSRISDANRLQQRPLSRLATASRPQTTRLWQPRSKEPPWPRSRVNDAYNEEMLDVLPGAPLLRSQRASLIDSTCTREAEAVLRHLGSGHDNEFIHQTDANIIKPATDPLNYPEQEQRIREEEAFEPTSFAPELSSFYSQQLGDQLSCEQLQRDHYCTVDRVQDEEEEVECSHREAARPDLAGFWRPNVLY